ncbi:MAG: DUF998 domain-containing protein [Nitrososphaeria archaeon]
MKGPRSLLWAGIIASIYIWVILLICYHFNPGFVLTRDALSQFGAPSSRYPFIYNLLGMVATGVMLMLFSVSLISLSVNRLEVVGSSFLLVASMFLMLIGIYHEGTEPHVFVSTYFFYQTDLSIVVFGAGSMLHDRAEGMASLLIGLVAPAVALLIKWPSSATLEIFGIACIELWAIITVQRVRRWQDDG